MVLEITSELKRIRKEYNYLLDSYFLRINLDNEVKMRIACKCQHTRKKKNKDDIDRSFKLIFLLFFC